MFEIVQENTKMFKNNSFLGNKKLSLNQNGELGDPNKVYNGTRQYNYKVP